MRKNALLILFFFLCFSTYAQTRVIDSLKDALVKQKEDTNRVNNLILLSKRFRLEKKFEEGLASSQQALTLANKLKFKKGKAYSHYNIALSYFELKKRAEAIWQVDLAIEAFREINDKRSTAEGYNFKGRHYIQQGNHPEALKNYYKALVIYQELKDKQNTAIALANIGYSHQHQTDYKEAVEYMQQSLQIWEGLGNEKQILETSNLIGSAYVMMGKYEQALEKYLYAMQIANRLNDKELFISTLNRLGGDYEFLGDKARGMGDEKQAEKLYSLALKNFTQALDLINTSSKTWLLSNLYWHYGSLYTKFKKYQTARDFFKQSLAIAKVTKHTGNIVLGYHHLAHLDSIEGDYKNAYIHYKESILYRDSTINDESVRKTAKVKIQYEFEKKEDSLKLQQQLTNEKLKQQQLIAVQQKQQLQLRDASLQLSNQQKELNRLAYLKTETMLRDEQSQRQEKEKQILILEKEKALQQATLKLKEEEIQAKKLERAILVVSALAIVSVIIAFSENKRRKQKATSFLEKQRMRTQIASDLHDDIGSELTSISFYSEMVKRNVAEGNVSMIKHVERIGENARSVINTMSDIVWIINPHNDINENLIKRMRSYAAEICNERNIVYQFKVDDEIKEPKLDMKQRKNIYLIYKEALHNAVKYAGCSKISVSLSEADHQLKLVVQDNGRGFDITSAKDGNGLNNMKRRAIEMNASLHIESCLNRGTSVILNGKIT